MDEELLDQCTLFTNSSPYPPAAKARWLAHPDAQMGREQPWHGIYAGETRLLARLLTDSRRTADPALADAFYVPSWYLSTCGGIGQMHSGACMQVCELRRSQRVSAPHSPRLAPLVCAASTRWARCHACLLEASVALT
jgi:hypothetical protein